MFRSDRLDELIRRSPVAQARLGVETNQHLRVREAFNELAEFI
jgi:hypothetical protein